jgi:hypothetical protein
MSSTDSGLTTRQRIAVLLHEMVCEFTSGSTPNDDLKTLVQDSDYWLSRTDQVLATVAAVDMTEIERIGGVKNGHNPDIAYALHILELNDLIKYPTNGR